MAPGVSARSPTRRRAPAWGSSSTSSPITWRWTRRIGSGLRETLRRRFFDIDPATGRWRRFADIDGMAGVRQEDGEVFDETHRLILELVDAGLVDGLRIDHVDGLADPAGYLDRLHAGGAQRIWVEKILAADERLPDWPVSGTVGYEFSNEVVGLFIDPAGEAELTAVWERVSGDKRPFGAWALEAKLEQALTTFRPELERLARVAGAPVSRTRAPNRGHSLGARLGRPYGHPSHPWVGHRQTPPSIGSRSRPRRCRSTAPTSRRRPASSSPAFSKRRRRSWPRGSGHRLLPVWPIACLERRRRRSGALRDRGAALPRHLRRASRAVPGGAADDDDPRRQALGRFARAACVVGRDGRGVAAVGRAVDGADRATPRRRRAR